MHTETLITTKSVQILSYKAYKRRQIRIWPVALQIYSNFVWSGFLSITFVEEILS